MVTPRWPSSTVEDGHLSVTTASDFLKYSIQSIGLKYLPLGKKTGKTLFQDNEFISYYLVDFRIPVLTKHTGDFLSIKSGKTREQIHFNRVENYWFPTPNNSSRGQKIH